MTRPVARLVLFAAAAGMAACRSASVPPAPTVASSQQGTQAPPPAATAPYAMTMELGAACGVLPQVDRTRTYGAALSDTAGGGHIVTLTNGRFLSGLICTFGSGKFAGLGCHQFFAEPSAKTVTFTLDNNNDEGHGGHIVEQTSAGWVEIFGTATGPSDEYPPSSVEATGTAQVWYCQDQLAYPFPCSHSTGCSADLRISLKHQ